MPTAVPTTSQKVEVKDEEEDVEEEEEEEEAAPLEDEEGTPQMHQIFQLWEAAKRGNPNMARLEDKQIKAGERSDQERIISKQAADTIRLKQDKILVEEREEEECMERESTLFEEFRAAVNIHVKGKIHACSSQTDTPWLTAQENNERPPSLIESDTDTKAGYRPPGTRPPVTPMREGMIIDSETEDYKSNKGSGEEEMDEEAGQVCFPTSDEETENNRSSAPRLESVAATPTNGSPTEDDGWEQLQLEDKKLGSASECASNKLTGNTNNPEEYTTKTKMTIITNTKNTRGTKMSSQK